MSDKSEKPKKARVSATEASRAFSDLLDQIEIGHSFIVHRHGRDVCVMTAPPLDGRRASKCLELLRGRPPALLDDGFSRDLLDIVSTEPAEDRPSWDS
ncbi:MAG: type II toxin-antitoxin system Phd/YefM family antitoxin [Planctomycetota bacterium]|nr:type II toxin-antitoxin system Phd/YefM family antitoxin [Planctomycetota bacterium]